MQEIFVCPSLLSADIANLSHEVFLVKKAGAHALHVDVMDGHFVKNISFGVPVVESLKNCGLPMDVHLMVTNPFNLIESFVKAGASILNFHVECFDNVVACVEKTKSLGCKVGLALKPFTSACVLNKFKLVQNLIDLVLVMTVEPGFAGQEFIESMVDKVKQVRSMSFVKNIAVDGGINLNNAPLVKEAGANFLVAGSSIFKSNDYEKVIGKLKTF